MIEATYGPMEQDEDLKKLTVDVTVAVQALVHNSQVYVPGHRTKVSLVFSHALEFSSRVF